MGSVTQKKEMQFLYSEPCGLEKNEGEIKRKGEEGERQDTLHLLRDE